MTKNNLLNKVRASYNVELNEKKTRSGFYYYSF